jgi:hypothetical protein
MNTYEGNFTENEKRVLDTLFGNFHFKHVGNTGNDFYYADKKSGGELIHLSGRNLTYLSMRMLKLGLSKDE